MIKSRDGKLWLPDGDNWGWSANYERSHFKKAMAHVTGRKVALDVGAHVGIWSLRLAEAFDEVICFEPMPRHYQCHAKNVRLDNSTLHKVGLSSAAGTKTMRGYIGDNSGRSKIDGGGKINPKLHKLFKIEVKTLDEFKIPKIDFMKVDVEEHESEMLDGAAKTIKRCKPLIFIEIWPRELDVAVPRLERLGYRQKESVGSNNYIFAVK